MHDGQNLSVAFAPHDGLSASLALVELGAHFFDGRLERVVVRLAADRTLDFIRAVARGSEDAAEDVSRGAKRLPAVPNTDVWKLLM